MTSDKEKNKSISEADNEQTDLMDLVEGNGPWQWSVLIVGLLCVFPSAANNMSMTFIAPNVDHWCARPSEINMSVFQWKETALPPSNKECSRYRFINNSQEAIENSVNTSFSNDTIACDSWEYDYSVYSSTIVSQWNLVCDQEWLISMSKSIFIAGIFLSSTLFAYLTDKFGRKPLVIYCNILSIVSGICCIYSTSFLMFAISRFFISAAVSSAELASTILTIEVGSPRYRSPYYCALDLAWIAGAMHLPLIAWWLRDWTWIQFVITVPNVFLLVICWLLPESPRWLITQRKTDEAVKVLLKAAKRNGLDVSDIKLKEMVTKLKESNEDENTGIRILDLFRSKMRVRTFVMWLLWSANAFVYYGISYNTNEFAGDPFLNFALYFVVEIPATILVFIVIQYQGRRRSMFVGLVSAGVACLLLYPIPNDFVWLRTTVSLIGKFFISGSFALLGLFTAEVFPTHLRNCGYGSASAVSRFATFIAPFVRELGRAGHPSIPPIVFGILSITSGGLALLLPETTNCSVPDTVKEAVECPRKTGIIKPTEKTRILNNGESNVAVI